MLWAMSCQLWRDRQCVDILVLHSPCEGVMIAEINTLYVGACVLHQAAFLQAHELVTVGCQLFC